MLSLVQTPGTQLTTAVERSTSWLQSHKFKLTYSHQDIAALRKAALLGLPFCSKTSRNSVIFLNL